MPKHTVTVAGTFNREEILKSEKYKINETETCAFCLNVIALLIGPYVTLVSSTIRKGRLIARLNWKL